MFIVLLDEPGLFVFTSAAEAVREIEPPDAETEIRAAFDDAAVPYRVEWIRPNRHYKGFFGFPRYVEFGEYRFVASGLLIRLRLSLFWNSIQTSQILQRREPLLRPFSRGCAASNKPLQANRSPLAGEVA